MILLVMLIMRPKIKQYLVEITIKGHLPVSVEVYILELLSNFDCMTFNIYGYM